jgi:hypothetical protein
MEKELQKLDSALGSMKIFRLLKEIKEHNEEIDKLVLKLEKELKGVKKA